MKPKIIFVDSPHPKALEILSEITEKINGDYNCADIIWTGLTPVECNVIVACPCTSVEHIMAPKIIYLNDEWKRTEGLKVTSTAEHTWSLILQLAKLNKMQLYGKTLGIIGCGRIGTMIEEYARVFGMTDRTWDKYQTWHNDQWRFNELLRLSDIITLHVPLEGNENFIGAKEIAMMKQGVLLVNTSRQQIVNIDELIPYLRSGKIK